MVNLCSNAVSFIDKNVDKCWTFFFLEKFYIGNSQKSLILFTVANYIYHNHKTMVIFFKNL